MECQESVKRLLWTGGWDSTFRLLRLHFVERAPVQPYYVVDPGRDSTLHEFRAMREIRRRIAKRSDHFHTLRPVYIMLQDDIPANAEITANYERLRARTHIGRQYEWLARFGHHLGVDDLEVGITRRDNPSGLKKILFENSVPREPGQVRLRSDEDTAMFRYFHFPLLHLSKGDMRDLAERHGFLDILQHAWFCHNPVFGKPCGVCYPCRRAGKHVRYSWLRPYNRLAQWGRRCRRQPRVLLRPMKPVLMPVLRRMGWEAGAPRHSSTTTAPHGNSDVGQRLRPASTCTYGHRQGD